MNFLLKISGSGNRFLLADKRHFNQKKAPKNWKAFIPSPYEFKDFLKLADTNTSKRKIFFKNLISQAPLADGLIVLDSTDLDATNVDSADLDFVDFVLKKSRATEKQLQTLGQKKLICSFYNKDGSLASMCGNAACCLSFYIEELDLDLKKFFFEHQEIPIAQNSGIFITKSIKNPLNFSEALLSFSKTLAFSFIDTGVPHGVVECSQLDFTDPKKPVGIIRNSTQIPPKGEKDLKNDQKPLLKTIALKLRAKNINSYTEGMNVSFYQVLSKNKLKAITFERGVEDWTLACGTGALAVSLVYLSKEAQREKDQVEKNPQKKSQKQKLQAKRTQEEKLRIEMPGGFLKVEKGDHLKLFSEVKKSF